MLPTDVSTTSSTQVVGMKQDEGRGRS